MEKGLRYCWECPETDCRIDVLEDLKPRAFNEFIRRYGMEKLMDCLERNEAAGVVYHRSKTDLYGDYDEPEEIEEIIHLILTGEKA
jgi:predicted TIM-barrel enzyme